VLRELLQLIVSFFNVGEYETSLACQRDCAVV